MIRILRFMISMIVDRRDALLAPVVAPAGSAIDAFHQQCSNKHCWCDRLLTRDHHRITAVHQAGF
ncbi:hypothetical protein ADL15_15570 [Actinoplanes awajinensis subsp. mycoplanecinus]|uniref:Uncharacterized protein n=1 Tax=Actinoplanes awajinensis subsp. mycoplanecinus TaxID=135947 RepID=A0A0X3UPV5_9ACTN|nr:hypothetical protein ADL15_15570 [Actinoplanes awajinensis subsp. mycoplanecinus]